MHHIGMQCRHATLSSLTAALQRLHLPRARKHLQECQHAQQSRCQRQTVHVTCMRAVNVQQMPFLGVDMARRPKSRQCSRLSALVGNDMTVWTALAVCAAASQVVQVRTTLGSTLGSPILAIIAGLVFSMAGVLPTESSVYDTIWQSIMPLAAALFLLEADLRGLFSSARDTTMAFVLASAGTLIGTAVAWVLLSQRLGQGGWQLASALTASYIGGSINFAAVSASLATPGPLVAAAMAADNVAMACYLALISFCPAQNVPLVPATAVSMEVGPKAAASGESMALSLAAALLACCAGALTANALGLTGSSLGFAALCASGMASLAGMWTGKQSPATSLFSGAEVLGGALMLLFFVTIGAAAGSPRSILGCGWLAGFMIVQLAVHLVVVLGVGKLVGLPMQALLTASNAAIGGPGTAAAMASSRGWPGQITPALLTGSLGYTIGTPIGLAVGALLQQM